MRAVKVTSEWPALLRIGVEIPNCSCGEVAQASSSFVNVVDELLELPKIFFGRIISERTRMHANQQMSFRAVDQCGSDDCQSESLRTFDVPVRRGTESNGDSTFTGRWSRRAENFVSFD